VKHPAVGAAAKSSNFVYESELKVNFSFLFSFCYFLSDGAIFSEAAAFESRQLPHIAKCSRWRRSARQGGPSTVNVAVTERDRGAIYGHYRPLYAAGNCPPGLAKKLWAIGRPLAAGVTFHPLPPALLGQLTPAPAGYQYVRVTNDVLDDGRRHSIDCQRHRGSRCDVTRA